ncbi:MAG: hypothetical protein ACE5IZ_02755 [Dehalococcoidia bacterium]
MNAMSTCAGCGATVPAGEAVCSRCKAAITTPQEPPSDWRQVIWEAIALLLWWL